MPKVKIPAPLRRLTSQQAEVDVEAATIKELIGALEKKFPGIKKRLCDDNGKIRKFLDIYVEDEDIRFLDGEDTKLNKESNVDIISAIVGG